MKTSAPMGLLLVATVFGCGSRAGSPAPAPATQAPPESPAPLRGSDPASTVEAPTPAPSPPVAPACMMTSPTVRLRIDAGQTTPTGTGLFVTFAGMTHDNYGPDGFDMPISLLFQRGGEQEGRMPSFRDHRPHEVLGHCFRLVDSSAGAVLLEVSVISPGKDATAPTRPSPPGLEGGGTPAPGAASCTVSDDNGPLPGGKRVTTGCDPNEVCVCEAQAGYSCRGHCAPASPR